MSSAECLQAAVAAGFESCGEVSRWWPIPKVNRRGPTPAPQQSANLMRSAIIGPDGSNLVSVEPTTELAVLTLDRDAPEFHIALDLARPWRAEANRVTSTAAAPLR